MESKKISKSHTQDGGGSGQTGENIQEISLKSVETQTKIEVGVRIAGNIANFLENWNSITNSTTILNWVQGYKIPFTEIPSQEGISKVYINKCEIGLYDSAIEQLIGKGAISPCNHTEGEFLSSYFLVPKSDGGHRFVLNLKSLITLYKLRILN